MPLLSVFRKGQDPDGDGLRKSISAHHDLLAACPMVSLDQQFRQQQQQNQQHQNQQQTSQKHELSSSSVAAATGSRNKILRTSKSDVLLSTVNHFPRADGATGGVGVCTQFGSCQIKSGNRMGGGASTAIGFDTLRKNSSSILSRIHALTTQKCLQISNSRTLLNAGRRPSAGGGGGGGGPSSSSSSAFLPPSASKSSMASRCSVASFRVAHCRLCLCDIPSADFYELNGCGCIFCRQCVEQYIKIQILDGNVTIPCPDGQCTKKGAIGILELELLADDDLYNKYKRFKLNTEVDLDQNRTWCPTAGCETICAVSTPLGGGKWQAVPITCPTCSKSYCSSCKAEWQTEHTCKLYTKKKKPTWFLGSDDRIVFSEGEDAPIKHCPVCRIPIERDSGCAQMMCKKCKHVFCWYCLASLDDDFLLRHYDKGPCKDKLGHSRASVIWHRAQVIGIFAGVALLLLLASPLLIITVPFVMCCKCKTCDRCHDPTADPNLPPVNL